MEPGSNTRLPYPLIRYQMTSDELEKKARAVRQDLEQMDMGEREMFMSIITEPFCKHCWTANPYCQCWNDE